jgi:Flp pilus assembly protein TadG
MKMISKSSFTEKFLNNQSGQVLIWVVLGFLSLVAMAGLVIDGGLAYADNANLQNTANAAALAATQPLTETSIVPRPEKRTPAARCGKRALSRPSSRRFA